MAALLAGCSPTGRTIRVVSSLPMRGASRAQSQTMVNAIEMAFDEADHQAGGCRLDYQAWDDATAKAGQWDPAQEEQNAHRAVSDPDVMVYIGTFNSGAAKVALPILNQGHLVMVSPANTYTGLTVSSPFSDPREPGIFYPTGVRNFCRLVPSDTDQGTAQAWWAQRLDVHRVYVLNEPGLYGVELSHVFADQCRRRGMTVFGPQEMDKDSTDYRKLAEQIKQSKVDLIYFAGITQSGAGDVVKAARQAGLRVPFMGPDGLRETAFIDSAGPAAEGALLTLGAMPVEKLPPKAKEWYDRYRQRFNEEPEGYAIYAYEAAKVTIAGIEHALSKDRDGIRQAIMTTHDYDGVLGTWSFDANGDTSIHTMAGYVVHNHHFDFKEMLMTEPASPPPPAWEGPPHPPGSAPPPCPARPAKAAPPFQPGSAPPRRLPGG
ncbi:MAG TPA: branched-chain amino acid ABC transporter substrate-binding protein [Candidatus Xenobia bacterium]